MLYLDAPFVNKLIIFSFLLIFLCMPLDLAQGDSASNRIFQSNTSIELIYRNKFPSLGSDFSGITYVDKTNHYLVVDDSCKIIEISYEDSQVQPIRTIVMTGFNDCEAIGVLPGKTSQSYQIAVTEERRGALAIFSVDDTTTSVDRDLNSTFYTIDRFKVLPNAGLEALAVVEDEHPVFYLGKEEFPKKIYKGIWKGPVLQISVPWNAQKKLPFRSDLADFCFFEKSLFVLSQRTQEVFQLDPESGNRISSLKLPHRLFYKYEGLALTRRNEDEIEMAIVSERNEIRIYRIKSE